MTERLDALKGEIIAQGRRVQALAEKAVEVVFSGDVAGAEQAVAADDEVDAVDVAIEKSAVDLLTLACTEGAAMTPQQVRLVLTIVKVNNELERTSDLATDIAELSKKLANGAVGGGAAKLPPTFRVLANSVIGILRDSVTALEKSDPRLAKSVLMSQATVSEFKRALIREAHQQLTKGVLPLAEATTLHDIADACVTMADHCANICEQVIYSATGTIVRHMEGKWAEVKVPGL